MSTSGLTALFLAQRPALLRFLAARLGSPDEAEDILQDMWFRLERVPTGPISDPAAYLFRMAANLATDRRVSGARRERRDDAWKNAMPADEDYPDAERSMIAADELRQVEAALAEMPERMRRALILFRVEERPQKAIAETLGITVSGVEKLLRRGYQQLTEKISGQCADRCASHRHGDEGSLSHD